MSQALLWGTQEQLSERIWKQQCLFSNASGLYLHFKRLHLGLGSGAGILVSL